MPRNLRRRHITAGAGSGGSGSGSGGGGNGGGDGGGNGGGTTTTTPTTITTTLSEPGIRHNSLPSGLNGMNDVVVGLGNSNGRVNGVHGNGGVTGTGVGVAGGGSEINNKDDKMMRRKIKSVTSSSVIGSTVGSNAGSTNNGAHGVVGSNNGGGTGAGGGAKGRVVRVGSVIGGGEGDKDGDGSPPMSVASVPVGMGMGGVGAGVGEALGEEGNNSANRMNGMNGVNGNSNVGTGAGGLDANGLVEGGVGNPAAANALREDLGFGELKGPAKVRVKRGVRERTRGLFAGLRRDSNAAEMGRRRVPLLGNGALRGAVGGLNTVDGGSVGGTSSVGGSVDGGVGVGSGGAKGRRKKGGALTKSAGSNSDGYHHHYHHLRNKGKQDLKKREKHLARRAKMERKGDRGELHKIDDAHYASPWQATEQLAAEVKELRAKLEEVSMSSAAAVAAAAVIDPTGSVTHGMGRRVSVPMSVPSSSLPPSPSAARRICSADDGLLDPSRISPRKRATLEAAALATRASASAASAARTQSMAASLTVTSTSTNGTGEDREQKSSDGDLVGPEGPGRLASFPRDQSRRNIDIEMLRLRFEAEGGTLSKEHIIQLILDMRAERENNRELRELVTTQRARMDSISRGRDELEAERDILGDRVRELESVHSEEESLRARVKVLERENERLRRLIDGDKKLRRSKGRANVEFVVESLKAELAASKARLHAEVVEGERLRKRLSMYEGSNGDLLLD